MSLEQRKINLEKRNWRHELKIECFGVKIGVRSNNLALFNKIKNNLSEILPVEWSEIEETSVEHWVSIIKGEDKPKEITVYKDEEFAGRNFSADVIYDLIVSKIRATIAEFASEYVFLHAGVVSRDGKAIIIPGKSRAGKTTLVLELIKRNCDYFSDEFAVIDKNGLVYPFPKKVSVRGIIDEHRQLDISVSEYGGKIGKKPVPAGYILITDYSEGKRTGNFKINSSGNGVMSAVSNSISVRQNPKFVLEVLSKIANQAIVLEAKRGEAAEFADFFLDFIEKLTEKAQAV